MQMIFEKFIAYCLLQIVRMDSTKLLVNCALVMLIIHIFFQIWNLYWTTVTDPSIFLSKIDRLEMEFRELEYRLRLRGRSILSTKIRKRKLKKKIKSNSKSKDLK